MDKISREEQRMAQELIEHAMDGFREYFIASFPSLENKEDIDRMLEEVARKMRDVVRRCIEEKNIWPTISAESMELGIQETLAVLRSITVAALEERKDNGGHYPL